MAGIDLDRGVTQMQHPNGYWIAMYKDDPGTYYDLNGDCVPLEKAAEAGFPTREHRVSQIKAQKMREATDRIEQETAEELKRIDAEAAEELDQIEAAAEVEAEAEPVEITSENDEIVRETGNGRPRETRRRRMEFDSSAKTWSVLSLSCGNMLAEGVSEEEAVTVLMDDRTNEEILKAA